MYHSFIKVDQGHHVTECQSCAKEFFHNICVIAAAILYCILYLYVFCNSVRMSH